MASPHLSSSIFQGEVELEMLILGERLGEVLTETVVVYHGAKMKVDGVNSDETVFVEAFAHVGGFKSGQRRKIATDALKFVALQGDRPEARFILAFVDVAAEVSVVGWLRTVIDVRGIELTVVDVPDHLKEKLVSTQRGRSRMRFVSRGPHGSSSCSLRQPDDVKGSLLLLGPRRRAIVGVWGGALGVVVAGRP
jgi:hypothetical protein